MTALLSAFAGVPMYGDGWAVERVDAAAVRPTIEADHYLKRWPDPRSLPFAYRLESVDLYTGRRFAAAEDGRPLGVLVFKKPQHLRQAGLFGEGMTDPATGRPLPTSWQVLDLARVWVHPDVQSVRWEGRDRAGRPALQRLNLFSRMVAMALRRLQRDWLEFHPPVFPHLPYHVTLVLSYCDRAHHQGTGYRASGFSFWGPTADGTKDLYVRRLKAPRWDWTDVKARTSAALQTGMDFDGGGVRVPGSVPAVLAAAAAGGGDYAA